MKAPGQYLIAELVFLKMLSGKSTTTTSPSWSGTVYKAPAKAIDPDGPAIILSSWFNFYITSYVSFSYISITPS